MQNNLLGLSSSYFAFRGKGIYESAKACFDLGFGLVELGAAHRFEKNAWQAVEKIKKDFPGKLYTVHSIFPPGKEKLWFNPSKGLTKQNRAVVDNLFKTAGLVEAQAVSVHPGFLYELGWGFDEKKGFDSIAPGKALNPEKSWEKFGNVVQYALKLARNLGIPFAIENVHGHEATPLVHTPAEFEKAFALFPELRLLFDYGHALFEETAEQMLEKFGERTAEVHLHWSGAKSQGLATDEHSAISSMEQLSLLKKIPGLKKIPVVFEHGTNVSVKQVVKERELVLSFLKGI